MTVCGVVCTRAVKSSQKEQMRCASLRVSPGHDNVRHGRLYTLRVGRLLGRPAVHLALEDAKAALHEPHVAFQRHIGMMRGNRCGGRPRALQRAAYNPRKHFGAHRGAGQLCLPFADAVQQGIHLPLQDAYVSYLPHKRTLHIGVRFAMAHNEYAARHGSTGREATYLHIMIHYGSQQVLDGAAVALLLTVVFACEEPLSDTRALRAILLFLVRELESVRTRGRTGLTPARRAAGDTRRVRGARVRSACGLYGHGTCTLCVCCALLCNVRQCRWPRGADARMPARMPGGTARSIRRAGAPCA